MQQSSTPSFNLGSDLAAMPLFSSLDLEITQAIATDAEQIALPAGKWLFRQGEASGALYVVLAGQLEVLSLVEGQGEKLVGEIGPGELIGEMEILSGKPYIASLRALTDVRLAKISKVVFEDIAQAQPEFLTWIGEIIQERLGRRQLFEALPKLFGPLDMETMHEIEARLEW